MKEAEINKSFILNSFSVKAEDAKFISEKARWYGDNESIFMGTHTGDVLHFSE